MASSRAQILLRLQQMPRGAPLGSAELKSIGVSAPLAYQYVKRGCPPGLVGITSFNEWHEGTQIEPAMPKQIQGFTYLDYQPLAPDYYLDRTAYWVRKLNPQ
jgi:hypothetical protein